MSKDVLMWSNLRLPHTRIALLHFHKLQSSRLSHRKSLWQVNQGSSVKEIRSQSLMCVKMVLLGMGGLSTIVSSRRSAPLAFGCLHCCRMCTGFLDTIFSDTTSQQTTEELFKRLLFLQSCKQFA
ncbi:hypothetical protein AVEN_122676-1 [Araneus ventricosus]|uniref:Uncharacterized protein n=1 Tax=Araneus ventricosus TaxID=182803 RepID=A0A4Y2SW70_ARAVE|nr:hypothetical protein AVEN_122676-1 [Araneus ventricosus]